MPRAINRCPDCGSTVTPYAAGCAVCGADIEGARAALAARRGRGLRLPSPGGRRFTLTDDGLRVIIALLVVVAAPLFGLFLACFFAFQAHTEGRTRTRNVMLVLAVLAAIPLATGISIWGRFIGGY